MAGPDAVILELPESFEFAFGCSGGDRFVVLLLRLHHLGRDSIPSWLSLHFLRLRRLILVILYCSAEIKISANSVYYRIRYANLALANCSTSQLGTSQIIIPLLTLS